MVPGGGSVVVTHIIAETRITSSLKKKLPVSVAVGEPVGTVAPPDKPKGLKNVGNNGMAHIHLEVSSKLNCPWIKPSNGHSYLSGSTPFDDAHGTRLTCAPNLPDGGPAVSTRLGQWSYTELANTCTEGDPPESVATGDVVFVRPVSGDIHIFRHRVSDNTDVDLFGDAYTEGGPDVSPDGSRIAFTRGGGSATGCYYRCIFVMNSDGSGVTQVTSFPSSPFSESRYDNNPRWSPDGQWLVFVRWNQNTSPPQWDVYKVRPDGSGLTALTTHGEADMVATWSPDGTRIAYDRKEGGYFSTTVQIHVMDAANGGNDHRVTASTSGYRDESPAWSPDGNRIYFASTESGNGDLTGLMYFSYPNGFADQTAVSRTKLTSPSLGQTDESPRVSADGNTVYFGSTRDVWEHIYKITYSGGLWGAPTAVTSGDHNDASPSPVNR
jgi:Tol biopolymer transport system component